VSHPDDEFHPPTSDDPYWTETCWFSFQVPERRLSGQLYPYFQPNQGVCAAAAYFWDDHSDRPWDVLHAKNFWHLPMPDQPLSDISLPNGIRYRCLESQAVYEIAYDDPDGDEISVRLTSTAPSPDPTTSGPDTSISPVATAAQITLHGQEIGVDSFGFRDRSWGPRTQFGRGWATSATATPPRRSRTASTASCCTTTAP